MATKATKNESALDLIKDYLGNDSGDISQKIDTSLKLLEWALECLISLGLISRLYVEVNARTSAGNRYLHKFSLGVREGEIEDECYLKQSVLEEDE